MEPHESFWPARVELPNALFESARVMVMVMPWLWPPGWRWRPRVSLTFRCR